jgi:hypothetical protein
VGGSLGEQHSFEGILVEEADTDLVGTVPAAERDHDNQVEEDIV